MKRLLVALLSLTLCATLHAATEWEAPLPKGAETDLVKLNLAAGNKAGADYIEREHRDIVVKLQPLALKSPKPKSRDFDALFVAVPQLPFPNMLGAGCFYLLKSKESYHIITKNNFSRLFGPIKKQEEVLPLITLYEELFGNSFATIVTTDKVAEGAGTPPDVTKITSTKEGFEVKLILHNRYLHAYFGEKRFLVRPD
jgi:hypothetical protein